MEIKNILQHYPESEKSFIIKAINVLEDVAEKYSVRSLGFCNPAQVKIVNELANHFMDLNIVAFGGFENAERKKVIVHSNYCTEIENGIVILKINYNKKFQTIKHNQILGTLLNDGYNIDKIGDIYISEDIFLIIDECICESIMYTLNNISGVKVSFEIVDKVQGNVELPSIKKKYVKSLRIDSVVKIITSTSREKSKIYFDKNYVMLNYLVVEDTTIIIEKNDIISIRGFGRITITNIVKSTKGYYIEYR